MLLYPRLRLSCLAIAFVLLLVEVQSRQHSTNLESLESITLQSVQQTAIFPDLQRNASQPKREHGKLGKSVQPNLDSTCFKHGGFFHALVLGMEDAFTRPVPAASSQQLLQENALPAAITSSHGKLSGSKSLLTELEATETTSFNRSRRFRRCWRANASAYIISQDWDLALNAVEDCIANTSRTLDTEHPKILPEGVPKKADLGETLEDIMESSLLSRTAWTKFFDEDGGRSILEILLRQLDDEQQDWTTELIESTTHELLQVSIAFLAGAVSMCVIGTVGTLRTVARPETKL
mmetsp:Transcript_83619/g.132489  ORF Transcript_83619/g.132489 Transcript_83619/m.132489 type:complete len:293 (-) Transcript_83619:32-910(-)